MYQQHKLTVTMTETDRGRCFGE